MGLVLLGAILNQKAVDIVEIIIIFNIWIYWMLFIFMDVLLLATTYYEAFYWIPFVAMGGLFAWDMVTSFRQDKIMRLLFILVAFLLLGDFIQG